jgi:hypothetical protein
MYREKKGEMTCPTSTKEDIKMDLKQGGTQGNTVKPIQRLEN